MSTLIPYGKSALSVVSPDPAAAGGLAINENFKRLSNRVYNPAVYGDVVKRLTGPWDFVRFGEPQGTAPVDEGSLAATVTLDAGTAGFPIEQDRPGVATGNGSIYFPTTSADRGQLASLGYSAARTGDHTYGLWFRTPDAGIAGWGQSILLGGLAGVHGGVCIAPTTGYIGYVALWGAPALSTAPVSDDAWHFVAASVAAAGTLDLYLDGVPVLTGVPLGTPGTTPLSLGADADPAAYRALPCRRLHLDEFFVMPGRLSPARIDALYIEGVRELAIG